MSQIESTINSYTKEIFLLKGDNMVSVLFSILLETTNAWHKEAVMKPPFKSFYCSTE